jgi:hypothetical protein
MSPARGQRAKNTDLQNLRLHGFEPNQIWCAIVQLACDLIARTQTCAITPPDAGNPYVPTE